MFNKVDTLLGSLVGTGIIQFIGYTRGYDMPAINRLFVDINKPTNTQQGDLMIAVVASGNNSNHGTWTAVDTGWTKVVDQDREPDVAVFWKIAGASEGSTYRFNNTINCPHSGFILSYRNAIFDRVGRVVRNERIPGVFSSEDYAYVILASFAEKGAGDIYLDSKYYDDVDYRYDGRWYYDLVNTNKKYIPNNEISEFQLIDKLVEPVGQSIAPSWAVWHKEVFSGPSFRLKVRSTSPYDSSTSLNDLYILAAKASPLKLGFEGSAWTLGAETSKGLNTNYVVNKPMTPPALGNNIVGVFGYYAPNSTESLRTITSANRVVLTNYERLVYQVNKGTEDNWGERPEMEQGIDGSWDLSLKTTFTKNYDSIIDAYKSIVDVTDPESAHPYVIAFGKKTGQTFQFEQLVNGQYQFSRRVTSLNKVNLAEIESINYKIRKSGSLNQFVEQQNNIVLEYSVDGLTWGTLDTVTPADVLDKNWRARRVTIPAGARNLAGVFLRFSNTGIITDINSFNPKDFWTVSFIKITGYTLNSREKVRLEYSVDGTNWIQIDETPDSNGNVWETRNPKIPAGAKVAGGVFLRFAQNRIGPTDAPRDTWAVTALSATGEIVRDYGGTGDRGGLQISIIPAY